MGRYERQMCLPEVGAKGQERLAHARVTVIGAGGLAASVLPLLAGAGVGQLDIFDPDRVEESNLHRQTLFRMNDLGSAKAEVAARSMYALNPECTVTSHVTAIDPANAPVIVENSDLIVDAADTFATTYMLSDICHATHTPLIAASVLGRSGYVGGFCGGAPSYRAVFPDLPPVLRTCSSAGVMGPAVASLGALQAQMCLSVLLRHDPTPLGQILNLDLSIWRLSSFRFDRAPEPDGASPVILAPSQLLADDLLIELRDDTEQPDLPRGAQRWPPESIGSLRPEPEQRVVFLCTTGLRAWRAARQIAASGHGRVAILADPV